MRFQININDIVNAGGSVYVMDVDSKGRSNTVANMDDNVKLEGRQQVLSIELPDISDVHAQNELLALQKKIGELLTPEHAEMMMHRLENDVNRQIFVDRFVR